MPRLTRSKSRTNPEFDPGELADLIYTPAVGSGVSSHLIDRPSAVFPAPEQGAAAKIAGTEDEIHLPTVCDSPTVVEQPSGPGDNFVDKLATVAELPSVAHSATVGNSESCLPEAGSRSVTTVDKPDLDTVADLPTVSETTTDYVSHVTSVGEFLPRFESTGPLWVTEDGIYLPPAKVRRIRFAQDALSAAEEMVYDLLWSQKPGGREESAKLVQAGYDFIMKRTRLSKKTVQRIIDKLIDKGFIEIDIPADIYRRTATTYRVFNYKTILERQAARSRFYVAKIGPGMVYVRQMARPQVNMATVDRTAMATVVDSAPSTEDKPATVGGVNSSPVTVGAGRPTTVVSGAPVLREQTRDMEQSSSSEAVQTIVRALAAYGPVDDDGARYLLAQCRRAAPDCTAGEILHFIQAKGELLKVRGAAVRNAVGFLLSAVPKCFCGETLRLYREEAAREREERRRREREAEEEVAALRAEQERILNDPASSEEDRRWARRLLGQSW